MFSASISVLMLLIFISQGEATTTLTVSPSVTEGSTAVTTGEATPTVGGTVTTAMDGGTDTTAIGGGTVTTAMGGGGGGATVTTAMGGGGGGGTITTAAAGGGGGATITTVAGGGGGGATVTTVAVGAVTTAMGGGGGGGTVTTAAGGGGISSATTSKTIPVSSVGVGNKKPGPKVSLNLIVTTNCSGDKLKDLNVSLQNDIKVVYTDAKFPIKTVITQSISCNPPLNITLDLSFYSGLPSGKTIKKVFQDALKNEHINSLTESNTNYIFKFDGVTLKYSPKDGECKAVCCDGGGGELTVELVCTPANNTCEGFETDEKKEDGHCPGDSKNTCPDTCESGGIYHSPSFAVVILLAIVTFTKTVFF